MSELPDQLNASEVDDLRSFMAYVQTKAPREHLTIAESMDSRWQLAAFTEALVKKMRMPIIEYQDVRNTAMPVVHNVCASLSRVAKDCDCTVAELECKLAAAYDHQIPPQAVADGPVRENSHTGDDIDLGQLPAIFYTDSQSKPYISAAHVVAYDPQSGSLNISFHRLMIEGKDKLAIYMTPDGHLDQIFQKNAQIGEHTSIAVFIGAHPLWSLGSLAAGSLSIDEFSVIGGLLGYSLPVVSGIDDEKLRIPAHAEIAIEGYVSHTQGIDEGPYGEAFGYVSEVRRRPLIQVTAMTHRNDPIFQDIVPGQLEHLTMTGVAVQVYLQKTLKEQFDCVTEVFLPSPMTAHVAVSEIIRDSSAKDILQQILSENRFIKHAVLFDEEVDISNAKQTQNALAMRVQAHRDVIVLPDQSGNGLDPSEIEGKTTKWGIDASSYSKYSQAPRQNQLPEDVVKALDVAGILERAKKKPA